MARIEDFDLADHFAPTVPRWLTKILFGLACAVAIGVVRIGIDALAAGAAPFALVYPAIVVATLFGGWLSGSITAVVSIGYAYAFIYTVQTAAPANNGPLLSLAVVGVGATLTIAIVHLFRRAVRRTAAERDRQIAERDLYLAEFEHRVKNNFAIVAGLLDMQGRRATDPVIAEALATARARVESIARAHRHLYRDGTADPGTVEMCDYLGDLCAALGEALFLRGDIVLECSAAPAQVPRDRAVSIGLIVNELVTNAVKHAFAGRERGHIQVRFGPRPGGGWIASIADDGVGLPQTSERAKTGLGNRLVEAFARQAGGTIHTDSDRTGTRVTVELAAVQAA